MTMVACPEIPRAAEAQSWAVYSLNINALMSPGWRQAKQPRQEQELAGSRFFVCLFAFSSHLSPNFQLEPRSAFLAHRQGLRKLKRIKRQGLGKSLECNELCGDRGGLGTFRVSSGREVWGTWVCPVPCPSFCRDTLWYWDCS